MANINLLKRAQTPQAAKKRVKNLLAFTSFTFFAIFAILLAIFFIINLSLAAKVGDINQQIVRQETEIRAQADVEVTLRTVNDKLGASEKIISQDRQIDEKIMALRTILPEDVFLQQASFKSDTFSISLTSGRLSSLDKLVEALIAANQGAKHFHKIVLEGLGLDEAEGTYRMSISGEVL